MKTKKLLLGLCSLAVLASVQSCFKDDNNNDGIYANAIVTVKPNADNSSFILQLNDSTILKPNNITTSPFGKKKVRAIASINSDDMNKIVNDKIQDVTKEIRGGMREYSVKLNWLDSIRTKPLSVNLGEKNEETYGKSAIEVVQSWETSVEDGYMTLRLRTNWGNGYVPYQVHLVATDPKDPYNLNLFYKLGDNGPVTTFTGDGLFAFDLSSLPKTGGKTVKLKLNWNSFTGPKSADFVFKTKE